MMARQQKRFFTKYVYYFNIDGIAFFCRAKWSWASECDDRRNIISVIKLDEKFRNENV